MVVVDAAAAVGVIPIVVFAVTTIPTVVNLTDEIGIVSVGSGAEVLKQQVAILVVLLVLELLLEDADELEVDVWGEVLLVMLVVVLLDDCAVVDSQPE